MGLKLASTQENSRGGDRCYSPGECKHIPHGLEQAPPFFASSRKEGFSLYRREIPACVLLRQEKCGRNNSKPDVPVPVVWVVPVPGGAAQIPVVIVECAAAQNTPLPLGLSPKNIFFM